MLAISLGVAWLLLAPLALWVLVKGRPGARVGAVVTLVLLEGATIAMGQAVRPDHGPVVVAHDMPPAPALPACDERTPIPQWATVGRQLVLSWSAAPRECATAKVISRTEGRRLLVWVHEGPLSGDHEGVRTLPVRVKGGRAALTVPLPAGRRYIPVDGRSGKRIPAPASL
ncbi:hypothetical protein ACIBIZ_04520 [Nonomuraea spiralis]|uniref:hypothetical protein n=1 Tax=Nonomuraea TaxID=83681 RepID=UPI000F7B99F4|nr:hypothetical protein [Nonomuraea sp. WAC 01424]RSN14154.1 hypothetical protein DMB42_06280 [Nonomuraea sp. WAC 01424]